MDKEFNGDKEFSKIFNAARFFIVLFVILAGGIATAAFNKIIDAGVASALLSSLSLVITSCSFAFLVLNTSRQILANEKQSSDQSIIKKKRSRR